VLLLGTAMAFVYGSIDVLFPAWLIAGPGRDRLLPGLLLGALGYGLGLLLWGRWGWRRPAAVLAISLVLQSLILMGAGLLVFEDRLLFWYGGLLLFSLVRFRRRAGDNVDGPATEGNLPLEIVWTAIPAVVVLFVGIVSFVCTSCACTCFAWAIAAANGPELYPQYWSGTRCAPSPSRGFLV
jgi:heme/copper-type cytochrome/quinol oxidase subunit 2